MGPKVISSSPLKTRLITTLPQNNEIEEQQAVAKIISLLQTRKNPVIVIDGGKLFTSSAPITCC